MTRLPDLRRPRGRSAGGGGSPGRGFGRPGGAVMGVVVVLVALVLAVVEAVVLKPRGEGGYPREVGELREGDVEGRE